MILVISFSDEEHTVDVVQRLERQGREVLLVDLADFPSQSGMALTWNSQAAPSYLIDTAKGTIDLSRVNASWWRRVRPFSVDPAITKPSVRAFIESETGQAMGGLLDALQCVWVNPRAADDAAHHKPYQWAVAGEVGLKIPRTLVTTKPDAARQFMNEMGSRKVVFKAFLASLDAWRETRLVEPADLERIDLVRYAPVIFQEYIEGVDLRITVVGEQVFAVEIDAQKTSYPVDMRMVIGESIVRPIELPSAVKKAVLQLQRRLGLVYGAIDMRRTAEGEYIFFEVNPAGQWLFGEQRTGLPISQAIADLLSKLDDQGTARKRDS